jgi:hypothetical protein
MAQFAFGESPNTLNALLRLTRCLNIERASRPSSSEVTKTTEDFLPTPSIAPLPG